MVFHLKSISSDKRDKNLSCRQFKCFLNQSKKKKLMSTNLICLQFSENVIFWSTNHNLLNNLLANSIVYQNYINQLDYEFFLVYQSKFYSTLLFKMPSPVKTKLRFMTKLISKPQIGLVCSSKRRIRISPGIESTRSSIFQLWN